METDKREAVARLEIALRGWGTYEGGALPIRCNEGDCGLHPDEKVSAAHPATPHDTDAGRLEWVELLRLHVWPAIGGERWEFEVAPTSGKWWERKSYPALREAITAAVEAAAQEVRDSS